MTTFIVLAALMAALAAAVVVVPLCRERGSRAIAIVAGLLIAGASAVLYPAWSTWNWHAPNTAEAAAAPDVLAMVVKLEAHLREDQNDLNGWLMLGRSYVALERLDDAILAYDHAHRLDAGNAEAALGLGEAMSLRAGGNIPPAAAQLFEQAVTTDPGNPKALLYGGFAAASRGDTASARARWQALKDLHPPQQIEELLDARIAELGPAGVPAAGVPAAGVPAAGASKAGATAGPPAEAVINVSIAPGLKSRLTAEAPLFVFAREPGGQGPPLAAKRLTSAALGTQIRLSASDSMIPTRVLVNGSKVSITARISFSGQPLPAAGDLYGEVSYDVGTSGARDLIIDRVVE